MKSEPAIFYSFRRCPYAMRARLALQSSGITVQLREIALRDKALEFLESSPKGSVPVLVTHNQVIEESIDIMLWTLERADPEGLLKMPDAGYDWISRNDEQFKLALDHTKYIKHYPNLNFHLEQEKAGEFLHDLNTQISKSPWMFGKSCSLADMAILPFVRQFANIDNDWFDSQGWQNIHRWLSRFLKSNSFNSTMAKYDKWSPGDPVVSFPTEPKLFPTQSFTV